MAWCGDGQELVSISDRLGMFSGSSFGKSNEKCGIRIVMPRDAADGSGCSDARNWVKKLDSATIRFWNSFCSKSLLRR